MLVGIFYIPSVTHNQQLIGMTTTSFFRLLTPRELASQPAQEAFVKEFDLKFPVLVGVGAQLARSIDIHHFPSRYLVEDGVITKEWRGKTKDGATLRRQLGLQ